MTRAAINYEADIRRLKHRVGREGKKRTFQVLVMIVIISMDIFFRLL